MRISRRIKPNHLRLVVAIADYEQLGLAADHLAISQPSASRSLAELEALLDTQLFVRRTKWMEPTEAGRALVRHGRSILAEFEALELDFDNAVHGYTGHVRIGTVTGPAAGFVVPALVKIQQRYPNIEVSVEVEPSSTLVRSLRDGSLDFVVGRLGSEDNVKEFHLTPVSSEEISLCVGSHHPLYRAEVVELRQLLSYPWVMQERGSPIRQAVESSYLKQGIKPPANVANASALLPMLSFLLHSDAVVPLVREVYELLSVDGLAANIKALPIAERIVVPPAFIIRNAGIRLTRAAAQVFKQIEGLGRSS